MSGIDHITKIETEVAQTASLPTTAELIARRKEEMQLEKLSPPTGYADLDRLIKGWIPGHLYTLTGNTGVGKTACCANFTHRLLKAGKRVLYFALEPDTTIFNVLASIQGEKRFSEVGESDLDQFLQHGNLTVVLKESVPDLPSLISRIENLPRHDLIIIDHVGYFIQDKSNPTQEQSNVVKRLAGLAKLQKTAILQIVHLNKSGSRSAEKGDQISQFDISGSAAFTQDATEVLIVVRDSTADERGRVNYLKEGAIIVTKQKSGSCGHAFIRFHDNCALILSEVEAAVREDYL